MRLDQIEPNIFIIFGTKGDLARRKLLPALYHLVNQGYLTEQCCILLGVGRDRTMDNQGYRALVKTVLREAGIKSQDIGRWCDNNTFYQGIEDGTPEDYHRLRSRIEELERKHSLLGNRIFYLSLPTVVFAPTITALGEAGLNKSSGWTRLVIEKPFGLDLTSAQQLNQFAHQYFDESQIYRIDHYLGKETVQNLLVFRFGNAIFESLWNRNYVESVQIIVAEELGVEKRADYYEQAGALRDMVQNHLTQLLTLIAMEVPIAFTTEAIHFEKVKVLRSIKGIQLDDVVFGQYTSGTINGQNFRGYLEEPGVRPTSKIETFVAMKLGIDNWRWQGVPFYICTGKRLPQKMTRIYINFRRAPICLFESMGTCPINSNALVITIQPEESYALNFEVKIPGEPFNLQTFPLEFKYNEVFKDIPEAYQTLLYDVLIGDRTLFVPAELVEASWQLYTPLLDGNLPVYPYSAGSWGPEKANLFFAPNIFH